MEQRIHFLDYLRAVSIFFIIMIHVSAQNWYSSDIHSFAWQTLNFYDCISRWSVPAFVMMSGALFLNKEITISQIYKKYIFRLVISFFIWSTFYCFWENKSFSLEKILNGKYHMWFIFMITGLYMLLPILQEIVRNKKMMSYFLLLAFIFTFCIPFVDKIIHDFFKVPPIVSVINKKIQVMDIKLVLGYTGYFVLGYFLNSVDLTKKKRIAIYSGGIMGFLLTILLQTALVLETQQHTQSYYGYLTLNVFLSTVAVFVCFRNLKVFSISNIIVQKLSKYSLGVYFVHVFILNLLKDLGLNTLLFNPVLSVPLITMIIYCLSVCVIAVLHRIPILKKYIA